MDGLALRPNKVLIWDAAAFFVSIWAASVWRLGPSELLVAYSGQALLLSLLAAVVKPAALASLGLYRVYWRHMARREYLKLVAGSLVASLLLSAAVAFLLLNSNVFQGFPRSVLSLDLLVATSLMLLGRKLLYRSGALLS